MKTSTSTFTPVTGPRRAGGLPANLNGRTPMLLSSNQYAVPNFPEMTVRGVVLTDHPTDGWFFAYVDYNGGLLTGAIDSREAALEAIRSFLGAIK